MGEVSLTIGTDDSRIFAYLHSQGSVRNTEFHAMPNTPKPEVWNWDS